MIQNYFLFLREEGSFAFSIYPMLRDHEWHSVFKRMQSLSHSLGEHSPHLENWRAQVITPGFLTSHLFLFCFLLGACFRSQDLPELLATSQFWPRATPMSGQNGGICLQGRLRLYKHVSPAAFCIWKKHESSTLSAVPVTSVIQVRGRGTSRGTLSSIIHTKLVADTKYEVVVPYIWKSSIPRACS